MLKLINPFLITSIFAALPAKALELQCRSLNPNAATEYFTLSFASYWAELKEDQFFKPKYGFTYDPNTNWSLEHLENYQVLLQNHWYYTASILLTLSDPFLSLIPGDVIQINIQGNDGDGTEIEDEFFQCNVLRESI